MGKQYEGLWAYGLGCPPRMLATRTCTLEACLDLSDMLDGVMYGTGWDELSCGERTWRIGDGIWGNCRIGTFGDVGEGERLEEEHAVEFWLELAKAACGSPLILTAVTHA